MRRRAAHLTNRQCQVLALTAAGNTTKEVAEALGISADTVNTHIKRMMTLVGVSKRTELITLAIARKILDGRDHPPKPTGHTCLRPAPKDARPPPSPTGSAATITARRPALKLAGS